MSQRLEKQKLDFRKRQANAAALLCKIRAGGAKKPASSAWNRPTQVKTEKEQVKGKDKGPEVKTAKTAEKEDEKLDFSSGAFARGGIAAQKLSYQIANSATVTAKVKRILDCLFDAQRPLRGQEILELTGIVVTERNLQAALSKEPRVVIENARLRYKPQYDCQNVDELLAVLERQPEGVPIDHLKDAYKGADRDLDGLYRSGRIYKVDNSDLGQAIIYPKDSRLDMKLDEDLKFLLRDAVIPKDPMLLESELKNAGLKVAGNLGKRGELEFKAEDENNENGKKKKSRRKMKITNTHLEELIMESELRNRLLINYWTP